MRRVLVIGGSGFLGRNFVNVARLRKEFELVVSKRNSGNLNYRLDLANLDEARMYLLKFQPEIVVNFAWITSRSSYELSSENMKYCENEIAFFNLCCEMEISQYISMGSSAEHYNRCSWPDHLNLECNQLNLYSFYKSVARDEMRKMSSSSKTMFNWCRIYQPYGPYQDLERFAANVINRMKVNEQLYVKQPNIQSDWISAKDIALGILRLIDEEASGYSEFGTGNGVSNRQFCELVAEYLGIKQHNFIYGEGDCNRESIARLNESVLHELGWKPEHNLQAGIQWTMLNQ